MSPLFQFFTGSYFDPSSGLTRKPDFKWSFRSSSSFVYRCKNNIQIRINISTFVYGKSNISIVSVDSGRHRRNRRFRSRGTFKELLAFECSLTSSIHSLTNKSG